MLFTFPLRYWFTIGVYGVFSLTGWCRQIQAGFLRSRLTQDTARPTQFLLTGLSPSVACLSRQFGLMSTSKCSPTTPQQHATMVWALPFSLATTWGIIIIFFSSGYLDVSVLRVGSLSSDAPSVHQVVPFGNLRIYSLCAAPRSLSQLTTSFIASQTQGIHHTPLIALKKLNVFIVDFATYCVTRFYNLLFSNMSKNFPKSFQLSAVSNQIADNVDLNHLLPVELPKFQKNCFNFWWRIPELNQ